LTDSLQSLGEETFFEDKNNKLNIRLLYFQTAGFVEPMLKDMIRCPLCNFQTYDGSSFGAHMKQHPVARPHLCPVCSRAFGRKDVLREHIRIHSGEKPYICRQCGKAFTQRGTLYRHEIMCRAQALGFK
jgi:uncharacterized Zn-finger protein